jgi:hypothetical protein
MDLHGFLKFNILNLSNHFFFFFFFFCHNSQAISGYKEEISNIIVNYNIYMIVD